MKRLLVLGMVLLPTLGQARQTALHDIPWYEANRGATKVTVQWCGESEDRTMLPDCLNARRANEYFLSQDALPHNWKSTSQMLRDPAYYTQFPLNRDAVLSGCAQGNPMSMPYCAAASQSAKGR